MFRWLRAPFAWKTIFQAGVYDYQENDVTGARRAIRWTRGGYSPVNLDWLDAGWGAPHYHPTIDGIPAWRTAQGQIDGRYCY